MKKLKYLNPKNFTFKHKGFQYEVVACHEYFADHAVEESKDPLDAIDFTGNYQLIIFGPEGTVSANIAKDEQGWNFIEDPEYGWRFIEDAEHDEEIKKIIENLRKELANEIGKYLEK